MIINKKPPDRTMQFLAACAKLKITRVAIVVNHRSVPASMDRQFSTSTAFQHPKNVRADGWPAIWKAAEQANVWGGTGNHAETQFQIGTLKPGVYHFKEGKWEKIKE